LIAVGSALRKVVLIIGTFFPNETRYFRAGGKRSLQRGEALLSSDVNLRLPARRAVEKLPTDKSRLWRELM